VMPKPAGCAGCVLESVGEGWCGCSGPTNARLLIVGEAPGRSEVAADPPTPMVGATGWEVNSALRGQRDSVRVANVRRCLPPEHEKSRSQVLSTQHCTRTYLHPEMADLSEVRTIVCVGGDALREVVGIGGISKVFGSVWSRAEVEAIRAAARVGEPPLPLPPRLHSVVAAIHPAAAMRGSKWMMPTIKQMIWRGWQWSQREKGPGDRLAGLTVDLQPAPEVVEAALREHSTVAMDVETVGRESKQISILGLATSPSEVMVMDWREPYISIVRPFLEDPTYAVIGHNFAFDMHALWETSGIDVRAQVLDTMNAAALLWPPVPKRKQDETTKEKLQLPWHSLALCVMRVFEGEAYWKEAELPWQQAFYQVAYGERFPAWQWPRLYCAIDALKTFGLMLEERRMMQGD